MSARAIMMFALVSASASVAEAQQEPPVDSLIADFVERGSLSNWGPHRLFEGCPALADWQERGIRRLMSADLSRQRTNDLAGYWMFALRDCHDPRLEQWFFERFTEAIRRGQGDMMLSFWLALSTADSPRIRDYLRGLSIDVSLPMPARDAASATLLERLGPDERVQEYLRVFETMRAPANWSQTWVVLSQSPERLLQEVGRLVSINPALADQGAFTAIAESSWQLATYEARRGLGVALQAGLDRAGGGVSGDRRTRLEETARWLRQRSP